MITQEPKQSGVNDRTITSSDVSSVRLHATYNLSTYSRIERAEEEQVVASTGYVPTDIHTCVVRFFMQQLPLLVYSRVVRLTSRALKCLWAHKAVDCAVKVVTPGLSSDVDDAALRLSVLRLKSSRFHLHLFDERSVDAGSERTV